MIALKSAVLQKGKLLKHSNIKHSNIIFNWRLSQRQYSKAAPTVNTAEEKLQSSSKHNGLIHWLHLNSNLVSGVDLREPIKNVLAEFVR